MSMRAELESAIAHRGNFKSTAVSKAISVRVRKGVVTLGGHPPGPTVSSVVAAVAKVFGVKNLILDARVYPNGLHGEAVEWPSAGMGLGGLSMP